MADDTVTWRLELDEDEYRRSVNKMIADSGRLDSKFDDLAAGIRNIDSKLSKIDGSIDVRANVDDSEIDSAKSKRDDLDANTNLVAGVDDLENIRCGYSPGWW